MNDKRIASVIDTDVLIVGSGIAGLMLALRLQSADLKVVLVSKAALSDSNSSWAQGGVAAVTGANPFDSPEAHLIDTIKSGAGLTDVEVAKSIIFDGHRLIAELDRLGVAFEKNPAGKYDLALEGGHKQARVVHNKDTTGKSITEALSEKLWLAAVGNKNLIILENTTAIELRTSNEGCCGATLLNDDSKIEVRATHTVLATGGAGQIFERTTNPLVATADGIALAYRAGAVLSDLEFVQFHPTALRLHNAPSFLITEAARGAGATLLDHKGQRFVKRFHEDGELATRDIVARAIHSVMTENDLEQVYLDMRPIGAEQIKNRFPNILQTCSQYGIDLLTQPIPVAPAAHYMMGGIKATVAGRTSMKGLSAIGECACTGLHGANRLASNSLLEAGVMALNLGDELIASSSAHSTNIISRHQDEQIVLPTDVQNFRAHMYRHAGLVRSQSGLNILLKSPSILVPASKMSAKQYCERNIFQVGLLIAQAALLRTESRGSHLREDYATVNDGKFIRHFEVITPANPTPVTAIDFVS